MRRLPPLRAVQYFEAAADCESLVEAASELGVTKGAVGQQVRVLEAYLGLALFERVGRGIRLTDAGRRYHSATRVALSGLERETERLSPSTARGTLRLSVLPAFASMWLVHRLSAFQDAHPRLSIELSSDAALVDFAKSDAHLGIRYADGVEAGVASIELCRDTIYPVCSPAYRDAIAPRGPEDLARCRLLHDNYWGDDWAVWSGAAGICPPEAREGQYFTLYSVAIDAARSGAGLAMGHDLLVRDLVARGDLVRPFTITALAPRPYRLVRPRRADHLSFVRAFEGWIVKTLEDEKSEK